ARAGGALTLSYLVVSRARAVGVADARACAVVRPVARLRRLVHGIVAACGAEALVRVAWRQAVPRAVHVVGGVAFLRRRLADAVAARGAGAGVRAALRAGAERRSVAGFTRILGAVAAVGTEAGEAVRAAEARTGGVVPDVARFLRRL